MVFMYGAWKMQYLCSMVGLYFRTFAGGAIHDMKDYVPRKKRP
jgi:hypothetical protein